MKPANPIAPHSNAGYGATVRELSGRTVLALLFLACGLPAATASPAFDCSKAEHEIEQLI